MIEAEKTQKQSVQESYEPVVEAPVSATPISTESQVNASSVAIAPTTVPVISAASTASIQGIEGEEIDNSKGDVAEGDTWSGILGGKIQGQIPS